MTDFIDKFDQTKQEALDDQRSARSTIVGLLEHISTGLESQHHIPDKGGMRVSEPRTAYSRCPAIGGQVWTVVFFTFKTGLCLVPCNIHTGPTDADAIRGYG